MAQKSISKKAFFKLIDILEFNIDYLSKSLFSIRCEKLLNKLKELKPDIDEEIVDQRGIYCEKDKEGRLLYEQTTVSDKTGVSQTVNSTQLRFKPERRKECDKRIKELLEAEINIPVYIITRNEENKALYTSIFKKYSPTTITALAEIILDVPLDEEGFIKEEFVLEMTAEPKAEALSQKE